MRYLCAWTIQAEEDWFDRKAKQDYVDLTGKSCSSQFLAVSKEFSSVLRHSKERSLFDNRASMKLGDLFQKMDWKSPISYSMTGAECAAFLLSNPKQRVFC